MVHRLALFFQTITGYLKEPCQFSSVLVFGFRFCDQNRFFAIISYLKEPYQFASVSVFASRFYDKNRFFAITFCFRCDDKGIPKFSFAERA